MDDFVRTVGEKSLSKLYDEATTLISKGSNMKNVAQLKYVLKAMHLVIEPLSKDNVDYRQAYVVIRKELKEAVTKEGNKAIVDSAPLTYDVLTKWFTELNAVIDDNNLLFSSSSVFQERSAKKWEEVSDDQTSL